jgi:hypothetical protein
MKFKLLRTVYLLEKVRVAGEIIELNEKEAKKLELFDYPEIYEVVKDKEEKKEVVELPNEPMDEEIKEVEDTIDENGEFIEKPKKTGSKKKEKK